MSTLARQSLSGWLKLTGGTGFVLFAGAGSFDFPQAWIYLAIVAAAAAAIILYLWRHDQTLLARRMRAGMRAEPEPSQRRIMLFLSAALVLPVLLPALDHRFEGAQTPPALTAVWDALVLLGLLIIGLTFRANSFAAATISIATGQTAITTGPYALVRHPMYGGLLLTLAATPAALGSWLGWVTTPLAALALAWRLTDEERILRARLPGYAGYCLETRYRLVPGWW